MEEDRLSKQFMMWYTVRRKNGKLRPKIMDGICGMMEKIWGLQKRIGETEKTGDRR